LESKIAWIQKRLVPRRTSAQAPSQRDGAAPAGGGRTPVSTVAQAAGFFSEYIALTVILIVFWQVMENAGAVNPVALPAPSAIFSRFLRLCGSGILGSNLLISTGRVLAGYAISAAAAITLGIVLGLSPRARRATDLIVQIMKPIPPIAWIPLVILWFGVGEASKIFLIFLGGFFSILINVIDGIRQTDGRLIEVARAMETPWRKYVFELVIPAALPAIFTGLKVGLSSCWMCVVAAELVAASSGLGYMIMNARQFSQTDVVIVGMLTIGVVGKLMDSGVKVLERRAVKWQTK